MPPLPLSHPKPAHLWSFSREESRETKPCSPLSRMSASMIPGIEPLKTKAHAQGVAEVINKSYTPSTQDEKDVFQLIQTFMYAVLKTKVLTSKGKEIVRKYESTKDAQAAYAELLSHHRSSTAAGVAARDIIAYLTTVTVGDGRCDASQAVVCTSAGVAAVQHV